MLNFDTINQARHYVREMSEEATVAIGDAEVFEYVTGEIEIVERGETLSDTSIPSKMIGLVCQVLY